MARPLADPRRRSKLAATAAIAALACGPDEPEATCGGALDLDVGATRVLASAQGCGAVDLTAEALGEGHLSVELHEEDGAFRPVIVGGSGGGIAYGAVLRGTWELRGDEDPLWMRQGYQSWAWSGVVEVEGFEEDADGLPIVGGDGDGLSVADETPGTSWWAGLLARPDAGLHVGALSAETAKVWLAASPDEVVIGWGGRGEARALAEGETWALDPVAVRFDDDAWDPWVAWATEVAGKTGASAPDEPPPTGWATWYAHYSDVDEEIVRDNLFAARALDWGDGTRVFQIDDGWQVVWGQWTAGDDFPSGMPALAADIAAEGFVPGLWMAPFYVDRSTDTYRDHADWWVRDAAGDAIVYTNLGTGSYVVIDVTHPDAAAWLGQQIAQRVAEGWTYLKLDFLYAGAQEGLRREPVTGLEAYRIGLDLIREAAGPDTWILACGAPLLPSVGWADSYRSGADIAFEVLPDPDPAYVRWQARQTAARAWANGVWWWNDPDQVLVRAPLDDAQARGAVVANAVSGGTWLLGDDLRDLGDRAGIALNPQALASMGATVRPWDPLSAVSGLDASPVVERALPDDEVPVVWLVGPDHIALYNGGEAAIEASAPPGTEVLTGATSASWHPVELAPGEGQLWRLR